MDIDPKAPGNISQLGVNSETDNETGFNPESPDVSDPAVDPLHPALTDNDPEPSGKISVDDDETPGKGDAS